MIREIIKQQIKEQKITQRRICKDTGIEYSALNTFLNGKKGIWYSRMQTLLDYLHIDAVCGCDIGERRTIQKAVWLEMRVNGRRIDPLAKETGHSYSSINEFVNGKSGIDIECAEQIMGILGITLQPYRQ